MAANTEAGLCRNQTSAARKVTLVSRKQAMTNGLAPRSHLVHPYRQPLHESRRRSLGRDGLRGEPLASTTECLDDPFIRSRSAPPPCVASSTRRGKGWDKPVSAAASSVSHQQTMMLLLIVKLRFQRSWGALLAQSKAVGSSHLASISLSAEQFFLLWNWITLEGISILLPRILYKGSVGVDEIQRIDWKNRGYGNRGNQSWLESFQFVLSSLQAKAMGIQAGPSDAPSLVICTGDANEHGKAP
ncbi:hypothetical protein DFH06DRAFT_1137321 [Mycena polygramma]|nr:hypothetical protein DFH06DRAFT_1137321 [Mycena polygramma]